MVSDLIDHANGTWDIPRLSALFPEDVIRRVLAIPVGDPLFRDELVWRFSKNGLYSSRSGYMDGSSSEEVADLGGHNICWSRIWDLHVPPKVRYFMWKVIHDILPTSINLVSRFVDVDPFCRRCGHEIETEDHILYSGVLCPMISEFSSAKLAASEQVWRGSKTWVPPAPGRMKLNTDAFIRGGRGTDVEMAEAMTVFRGMQIANEQRVEDVLVESDSHILISAITKSRPDLSYFGILVRHIVVLSKSFDCISFSWMCRTGNLAAHGLASFAFSCSDDFFDVFVPETLVPVVLADMLPI
ncbi:hypothetical protein ACS0TY_014680 [Phlomoides rotata]